jgi:BlaI family transcriptional regulator, penicillinase repressor
MDRAIRRLSRKPVREQADEGDGDKYGEPPAVPYQALLGVIGMERTDGDTVSDMMSESAPEPPAGLRRLGPLEADVMSELWRQREATVGAVLDALNGSREKQRAYTTVMTVLHRLARKGLAVRRRCGHADVYTASRSREEYFAARVDAEVAALIERYGDTALVHFVRTLEAARIQRPAG